MQKTAQWLRTVGRTIRGVRKAKKLTQEQAAERAKIGWRSWQRIERGQNATLEVLAKVAAALETHPATLLEAD